MEQREYAVQGGENITVDISDEACGQFSERFVIRQQQTFMCRYGKGVVLGVSNGPCQLMDEDRGECKKCTHKEGIKLWVQLEHPDKICFITKDEIERIGFTILY